MKYTKDPIIKGSNNGSTLIELVAGMAVINILMMAVISTFIYFSRDFKASVSENREEFYINEAFRYIENEILKGNREIIFQAKLIELKRYTNNATENEVDYIKIDDGNLIVKHTRRGFHEATNVFLRDIRDFEVTKDRSVIILTITGDKGEKYIKCINTQYIK